MTFPERPKQYTWGDLVQTSEGYFAIVLFQEGDNDVGVFLCNGLAKVESYKDIMPLLIKDGPARANFAGIIDEWDGVRLKGTL